MALNFRMVTDELFAKIGAEELAESIGCSEQAVKQARMDKESIGYRQPPPGWEEAAIVLAEQRITRLQALVQRVVKGMQ